MMASLLTPSLALALALVPTVTAGDYQTQGCHTLLEGIASQGHSDFELIAYCRANMPSQLCRDAMNSLGSQPWSPDRIASSCEKWEAQWDAQAAAAAPGRSVMDFNAFQGQVNKVLQAKNDAGLCKDPKTGGHMPLDKCVESKSKIYEDKTKQLNDLMSGFYGAVSGSGKTAMEAGKTAVEAGKKPPVKPGKIIGGLLGKLHGKIQTSEQLGPVAALSSGRVGMFVGLGLVVLSFAAAAAVTFNRVWRRVRKPEYAHQLVDGSPDAATPSDA